MESKMMAMLDRFGLAAQNGLASSQFLHANAEPYGDSVRLQKLKLGGAVYQKPPHLYLVYISLDDNGLVVRQYEKDIDPARIEVEEDNLIAAAKVNSATNKVGENFSLIRFLQASYFTIVIDEPHWTFYYPDPTNPEPPFEGTHDPIVFTSEKTFIDEAGTTLSTPVVRNRSFYDLEAIEKTIDGNIRKGIRCINFFTKSADGDPIGPGDEFDYTFNLFLRAPFSATVQQKVTLIIDPDGQNQGPPVIIPPLVGDEIPALVATEFAE
jgi:hypothetical protein